MISIVGLGNGASAIVEKFKDIPQYQIYVLNDKVEKNTSHAYNIPSFETPEEYEEKIPKLKKFFKTTNDRVQVFIMGSSLSSNYSLGILAQLSDKKVDVFYIKPDTDLLTGIPQLVENVVFGVLQEYARSGLFNSFTIFSNSNIEKALDTIPIKTYYDAINSTIFSSVHYLNYFEHTEPEIGVMASPAEINRIRTVGMLNMKNLQEKWLFDLDMERDLCYYLCINEKRLETEGGLHRKIVDMLKDKPNNAFRQLSYAIYETHLSDFGFCVAHTNAIQQQKTLDKLV
jgi:hypothetical protein